MEWEWEWDRGWDGMGWDGMGWDGGLTVVDLPHPASTLPRAGAAGHSPAAGVGGDVSIACTGLRRARASRNARAPVAPPEIALVNVDKRDRTSNRMECSRKGGLSGAPSPLPSASSHRSHHRGDRASRNEPRALGPAGFGMAALAAHCRGAVTFWLSDGTLAARLKGLVSLSTACAGP